MAWCEDCGTKLSGGICPNCSEELFIYTEQYEYLPDDLSDKFLSDVARQSILESRRNTK